MTPFRTYHLARLLEEWEGGDLPLDLVANRYFRRHRAIGSKDRREIAESAFGMVRHLLLLEKASSWEERALLWKRGDLVCESQPLHIQVSCPSELFDLLLSHFGKERALFLARWFNEEAPLTLRLNPVKASREELLSLFEGSEPTKESPWGVRLPRRQNLFQLEEFRAGLFEVQDEASQLIAQRVEAKVGDKVLDYCAGSGGKSLAFAHRLEGRGQLYLYDIRRRPLQEARRRLARAGVENYQVGLPRKGSMDWVLVDAPCSGTGTLRRNPDFKWKLSRRGIEKWVGQQRLVFEQALKFLKKGGRIVYATCSLLPEENMEQIEHFLETYSLRLVGEPLNREPLSGGMDAMFAAVMER